MFRALRILLLPAVSLLAIGGCTPPAERPDARAVATTDEFSRTIDIEGPEMITNPFFGVKTSYNIVTHIDKQTHRYSHVIETRFDYDGNFVYFQLADDDTAQALQLIPIRRVRNAAYGDRAEIFNIVVPDPTLRAHAQTGYRIRVAARSGEAVIINVSPAMIAAQYAELAKIVPDLGAAQSAATEAQPPPASKTAPQEPRTPPRPNIGLQMLPNSTSELTHGGMRGAVILAVIPDSPAARAGIHGGDLIVKFNGHAVDSGPEIQDLIEKITPNSVVKVDILRGPTHVTVNVRM